MINDFYDQTIILLDNDSSTSSTRGYFDTSTSGYTTATSILAAVNLLSGNEQQAYDKIGYDAQYKAYADVSSEIYEGRRCRWSGDTFEIVAIPKNTLQKNHHLKFLLRDVNNA